MTRALITGITGMDGALLADLLLQKGCEVHGVVRRSSNFNTARIDHIFDRLHLHHGDVTDTASLFRILAAVRPDRIYNLAAQSHVKVSFDEPIHTAEATGLATMRLLEVARQLVPSARLYQASSSEMFGSAPAPQSEATMFRPCSPYAVAKTMGYYAARNYRDAYGMFVANGILYNHEYTSRGETFVTRKITRAVGRIVTGQQKQLLLGHLEARRDWGWAPDYVNAMVKIIEHDSPDDFVIGTGVDHSVADFAREAFLAAGLDWRDHTSVDLRYLRPAEVHHLRADATKAKTVLGWTPSVGFEQLVARMVAHDIALARREVERL